MTKNSNLSNILEYIDEVCNTICEVSRMSGLYLDFVPWNLSVVFFTNYPPCLSLLVYIYSRGFHRIAYGISNGSRIHMCMESPNFKYILILIYLNWILSFLWNHVAILNRRDSIWKHLKSSGHILG